jgi:hypothetical protein
MAAERKKEKADIKKKKKEESGTSKTDFISQIKDFLEKVIADVHGANFSSELLITIGLSSLLIIIIFYPRVMTKKKAKKVESETKKDESSEIKNHSETYTSKDDLPDEKNPMNSEK